MRQVTEASVMKADLWLAGGGGVQARVGFLLRTNTGWTTRWLPPRLPVLKQQLCAKSLAPGGCQRRTRFSSNQRWKLMPFFSGSNSQVAFAEQHASIYSIVFKKCRELLPSQSHCWTVSRVYWPVNPTQGSLRRCQQARAAARSERTSRRMESFGELLYRIKKYDMLI